jgi:hypothetical protein
MGSTQFEVFQSYSRLPLRSPNLYIPELIYHALGEPVKLVLLALHVARKIKVEPGLEPTTVQERLLLKLLAPGSSTWTELSIESLHTLRSIKDLVRISEITYSPIYGSPNAEKPFYEGAATVMVEHRAVGDDRLFVFFTVARDAFLGLRAPVDFLGPIRKTMRSFIANEGRLESSQNKAN